MVGTLLRGLCAAGAVTWRALYEVRDLDPISNSEFLNALEQL